MSSSYSRADNPLQMDSEMAARVPQPSTVGASPDADEKHPTAIARDSSGDSQTVEDFPLRWKIIALVCGVMLSWGSSFAENILGPLKSTLKKELDINNSQYGAISSATSLVNTILPILGGYGLDYYGVNCAKDG